MSVFIKGETRSLDQRPPRRNFRKKIGQTDGRTDVRQTNGQTKENVFIDLGVKITHNQSNLLSLLIKTHKVSNTFCKSKYIPFSISLTYLEIGTYRMYFFF